LSVSSVVVEILAFRKSLFRFLSWRKAIMFEIASNGSFSLGIFWNIP